jgi:hypothetical protein
MTTTDTETKELHSYLWNAIGVSRLTLNIFCFIGLFTLGIPIIDQFHRLKNRGIGWMYWLAYAFISVVIFVKRFGDLNLELKDVQMIRLLACIALIIYISAWIHANYLLSKYRRFGRNRLDELNKITQDQLTMNFLMEKGLIYLKVLSDKNAAFEEFKQALQFSGGEGHVLSFVADHIRFSKQYNLAKQYYERALSNTENNDLIKHIKKILPYVEKILKSN